ncbi:hypothetical protein HK100_001476 [Physocladia obscura]|uniref:F-box domain-containing protein n=1 Tax=Physocladia obscura TaxID=109957 RepID=A0AAD5TDH4_9FUNG|nr:hypothetical protein HK100_001476 [Physocladia obscura]
MERLSLEVCIEIIKWLPIGEIPRIALLSTRFYSLVQSLPVAKHHVTTLTQNDPLILISLVRQNAFDSKLLVSYRCVLLGEFFRLPDNYFKGRFNNKFKCSCVSSLATQMIIESNYFAEPKSQWRALEIACKCFLFDWVRLLLNAFPYVDPQKNFSIDLNKPIFVKLVILFVLNDRCLDIIDGKQALQTSCDFGDLDAVDTLLKHGIDPNAAKISAYNFNHSKVILRFLDEPKFDSSNLFSHCKYMQSIELDLLKRLLKAASKILNSSEILVNFSQSAQHLSLLLADPRFSLSSCFTQCFERGAQSSEILKMLINHPTANVTDENNKAMSIAVQYGHAEIVEMLLNKNIDPSCYDNEAIVVACKKKYLEIIKILLHDQRVDPGVDNNICIYNACKSNHVAVIELLLQSNTVDPSCRQNRCLQFMAELPKSKWTEGHSKIVKFILDDPRVDPTVRRNEILIEAVKNENEEMVELLLQYGKGSQQSHNIKSENIHHRKKTHLFTYCVNAGDRNDFCMYTACKSRNLGIIKLLLQHESVNPSCRKDVCLQLIAGMEWTSRLGEIVNFMLADNRVNPAAQKSAALVEAVENNSREMVKLLLQDGRVDASAQKNLCIRLACEKNQPEIAEMLLAVPCVNPSVDKNVCIRTAASQGFTKVVQLLLNHKAVDPMDNNNEALIKCCENLHMETATVLLQDERVYAIKVKGICETAVRDNNLELIKLLIQK